MDNTDEEVKFIIELYIVLYITSYMQMYLKLTEDIRIDYETWDMDSQLKTEQTPPIVYIWPELD